MIALLNPRVLLVLAFAAFMAFTHFTAYRKGAAHVRQEWDVARAAADSEARRLEQARQRRAEEAGRLAAAREDRLRADAAGAADAVRGLRDALDAAEQRGSGACAAEAERAAAIGKLLAEGAEAHRELARVCDRHVNDIRLLLEAWPTDP